MATYQDIRGLRVKYLSADPSNTATGEVWYNSTTGTLRSRITTEAWSAGAPLTTGRNLLGRAGTQTAALAISGYDTATNPPEVRTNVESYNGSAWSEGPDVNTARYGMQGDGSQTAAIIAGGISPAAPVYKNATETYDGSSWTTSPNTINTTRGYVGHAGGPVASTASIIFGGRVPPGPASTTSSESWNGTSWTATPSLNNTGWGRYGCGTSTATLATGLTPPASGTTEEYNGASWTTVTANTAGRAFRGVAGIQTAALAFGSDNPAITTTEGYDGTNWSAKPALATARDGAGGTGTASAGLCFGDATPSPDSHLTEEFNRSTTVYSPSAYSSLPSLTNARNPEGGGAKNGSPSSSLVLTGGPGFSTYVEQFNGSSWTNGATYPATTRHVGGTGTQTAGLGVAGFDSTGSNISVTNEYNGASWATGGAYPLAQYSVSTTGTQTAAITAGGGADTTTSNLYNGASWTSNPAMTIGRSFNGSTGTQTAALAIGGGNAPLGETEEYNGASWSTGGNLATGHSNSTGSTTGTQTASVLTGANSPAPTVFYGFQQVYDGTSWVTGPALGSPRQEGVASGTSSLHLVAAGFGPGSVYFNNAEEFVPATTSQNIETLTTS